MKNSAVITLQRMSLDPNESIVKVLDYAYMIAVKLNQVEFIKFCNNERNGYKLLEDIPFYRYIEGNLYTRGASGNRIPIILGGDNSDYYRHKPIYDPISTVVEMCKKNPHSIDLKLADEDAILIANYIQKDEDDLYGGLLASNPFYQRSRPSYMPFLVVNTHLLLGIGDHVRRSIQDWSLQLEQSNVFGEELIFTQEEKEMSKNITYNYSIGQVENMSNHNSNTTVNQTSIKENNYAELSNSLSDCGINESDIEELKQILEHHPKPVSEDKYDARLNQWLDNIKKHLPKALIPIVLASVKAFFGL